jgi:hypothetical protein
MSGIRYVIRDKATQGCDFLLWGDDDEDGARECLHKAIADGVDAELIVTLAHDMDEHTRKLIEGK